MPTTKEPQGATSELPSGHERARLESQLSEWRQELLQKILKLAVLVLLVAFVICLWQVWSGHLTWDNALLAGGALVCLFLVTLAPRSWQRFRETALFGTFYFVGVIGSLGGIVSLYGAGFVGLVAVGALFRGARGAVYTVLVSLVHTGLVALAFNQQWISPMVTQGGADPLQFSNWARASAYAMSVGVVLAVCITSLLSRLQDNLQRSLELIERLEKERDQRAEMQEQMQRTERMEALGRLAGGIAHDFNNALTVMGSEADYIVSEIGEGHPVGESAEIIRQATERAATLTRRLLLMGRHKEFLRPCPVNLMTVINDFVRISRRVLPGSIEFSYDKCDPAVVNVDESALHQVLLNLAINAGDAMVHEGRITLACGETQLAEGDTTLPAGKYGFIRVSDTGTGISADDLSGIFDPFFTTKGEGRGSGMSLATSYGFASASGGTIEVESELGVGTTFTLYFPWSDERVRDSVAHLDTIAGLGKGQLALLAEDNLRVRAIIWSALVDAGYEVLEAADGEAAHELATNSERPISVLVTDFRMPKMDGVTLAERCHEKHPNMKIVVVTGYATSGASDRLREIPNTHLLPKPFGRRDLYRALGSLN